MLSPSIFLFKGKITGTNGFADYFGVPQMGGLRDGGKSKSKDIEGKKAFFLRFLDFPSALRTLWKRAKKAEKGRKRPILADF